MDRYAEILASLPGLKERLDKSGLRRWLKEQPKVEVEGQTYVVLGGDRLASEAEAAITFAIEHGLVDERQVQAAASGQPLPPDVSSVNIDTPEGDE